jgi:hypothetical protein
MRQPAELKPMGLLVLLGSLSLFSSPTSLLLIFW